VGSNYPDKVIEVLAVTVRRRHETHFLKACPCGACRQVLAEYQNRQNTPIRLLLQAEDGKITRLKSVGDLLPFMFTKDQL
jgi:cytidine deaminase